MPVHRFCNFWLQSYNFFLIYANKSLLFQYPQKNLHFGCRFLVCYNWRRFFLARIVPFWMTIRPGLARTMVFRVTGSV